MATLPTSCGMIDPHSGSLRITSVASDSCSSSCGNPPKTFNMRDLFNAARKTSSGNGGSVMLQPSGSKQRIEKTGARHRMNRKEYEMIVGYLEDPEHLVEILGSGRKTKVSGKHPSKQTAFGVMAVHLASMYAIFGHRANIVPPATAEDGLPPEVEVEEDSSVPNTFLDSQVTTEISAQHFHFPSKNQCLIGNEGGSPVEGDEPAHAEKGGSEGEGDEIAHAETENLDDEFGDDGGAPDDEQPFIHVQPSSVERQPRATSSQQTNERVSNEAPTARSDGKRPASQRSSLVSVYENAVREKTLHRKQIMESKKLFREQMLIERRMARVQKERFLEEQVKESQKRARIDRRISLLTELTKAGKSVSEIQELFQVLDSVEKSVNDTNF
ncbi:hypothetical protein R1flu_019907 [Riccia fluitans]|uniref:Uncharacterized protein n=1 Tax=Riccia fluitans TaxID=41844 RepID=A0ABD1ZK01_9MARC